MAGKEGHREGCLARIVGWESAFPFKGLFRSGETHDPGLTWGSMSKVLLGRETAAYANPNWCGEIICEEEKDRRELLKDAA